MSAVFACALICTFVGVIVSTHFVQRFAIYADAIDRPGGRRVHTNSTPKLGGLAVLLGIAAGLSSLLVLTPDALAAAAAWKWTAAGAVWIVLVGAIDDLFDLPPYLKLGGQTLAALIALGDGASISYITNLTEPGALALAWAAGPVTLLWIVLVTNAFNLLDGLDGLASGVGAVVGATLAVLAAIRGDIEAAAVAALLSTALVGFLYHNWHPAKIFLGDCGSLLVGYLLALIAVQGQQKGTTATLLLVPLIAFGLPLFETGLTVLRRATDGGVSTIFLADRDHIHHRLLKLGFGHRGAVLILCATTAMFCVGAISVLYLHGVLSMLLIASIGGLSIYGVRALGYFERRSVEEPQPKGLKLVNTASRNA